jgi:hypothetical protein
LEGRGARNKNAENKNEILLVVPPSSKAASSGEKSRGGFSTSHAHDVSRYFLQDKCPVGLCFKNNVCAITYLYVNCK